MKRLVCILLIVLVSSCQVGQERPPGADYAAWSEASSDGSWTRVAESAVAATSLASQMPKDINKFCPAYSGLNGESRVMFWVGLLSAIAKYESNFTPGLKYTERLLDTNGNQVISRGLLQLSVESANQKRYACAPLAAEDLHDPATNLTCGARILSNWVEADGVVAHLDEEDVGGARYWSALRPSNDTLANISAITRGFGFCGV